MLYISLIIFIISLFFRFKLAKLAKLNSFFSIYSFGYKKSKKKLEIERLKLENEKLKLENIQKRQLIDQEKFAQRLYSFTIIIGLCLFIIQVYVIFREHSLNIEKIIPLISGIGLISIGFEARNFYIQAVKALKNT